MTAINRIDTRKRTGIGGWLLVLCVLLLAWRPLGLAVTAAGALDALAVRGLALVLVLLVRLLATAAGVAITNLSSTEPLVMLKHFNPGNPEMPRRTRTHD